MESPDLQQIFFSTLKNTIPANISMVDEIAEVLNIGYDSVYRRIRGEKPIAMSELKILCDHFHISLDQVLQIQNDSVVFQAPGINNDDIDFTRYLAGMLSEFKKFNTHQHTEMLYLCKDVPIWHFFLFPEIAAFKFFCWIKTIQNHPDYQHKLFSLSEYKFDECYKLGQQIVSEYNKIPSVELWSFESLNSSINQIEYYRDAKLFAKPKDLEIVLNSLKKMLNHLMQQAEAGLKYMPGVTAVSNKVPYKLYINEVLLGNNTILITLDENLYSYINYNAFNYLRTKDQRFSRKTLQHFNTLLSRSTLISGTGEKYRNKYFAYLEEKLLKIGMLIPIWIFEGFA
jgi:hypothetical protein